MSKAAWDGLPADLQIARTVEKGHGRIETRELAATSEVSRHLAWPGAAQVCRIQRRREIGGKCSHETVYAITSLPRERASADDLLALNRQHWAIENRLHWRRDTAFAEDRSPIRCENAPQALASLRNTVLRLLQPFQAPTRTMRQIFAENRDHAIKLIVQPLL